MTAPYLLFSDVHAHDWDAFSSVTVDGVNSRLVSILSALTAAYEHLYSVGGTQAFCAGDLFHERGKIRPSVMNPVADFFASRPYNSYIIPGNHDLESNETTWQGNALFTLPKVISINEPDFFKATGQRVCMIPWQPSIKALLKTMEAAAGSCDDLENTDLIIHAPLDGVLRGVPAHGLTPERLFAAFPGKRIFCGHYHHHIQFGNVYSIGALTHQTWSDVSTKAGYLLVYPDRVEHHETSAPKFVDVDDLLLSDEVTDDDIKARVEGNYARLSVADPTAAEVGFIREKLTDMGARGSLVRAIATGDSMTTKRASVGASLERLDESVTNYAEKLGGPSLATLCESILKSAEISWTS